MVLHDLFYEILINHNSLVLFLHKMCSHRLISEVGCDCYNNYVHALLKFNSSLRMCDDFFQAAALSFVRAALPDKLARFKFHSRTSAGKPRLLVMS